MTQSPPAKAGYGKLQHLIPSEITWMQHLLFCSNHRTPKFSTANPHTFRSLSQGITKHLVMSTRTTCDQLSWSTPKKQWRKGGGKPKQRRNAVNFWMFASSLLTTSKLQQNKKCWGSWETTVWCLGKGLFTFWIADPYCRQGAEEEKLLFPVNHRAQSNPQDPKKGLELCNHSQQLPGSCSTCEELQQWQGRGWRGAHLNQTAPHHHWQGWDPSLGTGAGSLSCWQWRMPSSPWLRGKGFAFLIHPAARRTTCKENKKQQWGICCTYTTPFPQPSWWFSHHPILIQLEWKILNIFSSLNIPWLSDGDPSILLLSPS